MRRKHIQLARYMPSTSFALLVAFSGLLWIAGGASRADVSGQAFVRLGACIAIVLVALFGRRPTARDYRPVLLFLCVIIGIVSLQLVPLPPEWWTSMPGRARLSDAAVMTGQAQPWRPLSLSPGMTLNALLSLLVPSTTLLLLASIAPDEQRKVLGLLLGLIAASAVLGLIQFSSGGFDHPLINDSPWYIAGTFANRNHFALWLAMGCLVAPVWAFRDGRVRGWRPPVALAMILLFVPTILATGSRAGLIVGALALILAPVLCWPSLKQLSRHTPRWAPAVLISLATGLILGLIAVMTVVGRSVSFQRLFALDASQDMRLRALPSIFSMLKEYLPAGTGFGTFDTVFRIHEPLDLLKPTYFNHAHNDFLEILLDGGLAAGAVLLAALAWWIIASYRAWRSGPLATMARLGSAMLLLLFIASLFDYPARVPTIMMTIVFAAAWLSTATSPSNRSPLPAQPGDL